MSIQLQCAYTANVVSLRTCRSLFQSLPHEFLYCYAMNTEISTRRQKETNGRTGHDERTKEDSRCSNFTFNRCMLCKLGKRAIA